MGQKSQRRHIYLRDDDIGGCRASGPINHSPKRTGVYEYRYPPQRVGEHKRYIRTTFDAVRLSGGFKKRFSAI